MPEEVTPTPEPTPKPEKQPDYRRLSQKLERELQQTLARLEATEEQVRQAGIETAHLRDLHQKQHQYYQTALLTIVENLKVMMRTIAILAGKVE